MSEQKRTDARLTAAAQELLEATIAARHQLLAVLGMVDNAEHRGHIDRAIALADAAIAKAVGK